MAYLSTYRGTVTDRKDPEQRGRLKVKVPMIYGEDEHDYWAEPKGLFSGIGIGLMAIPEVGDNVWIEFENGSSRFPIWQYGTWDKDKSLAAAYDGEGEPTKTLLKTKAKHLISIDDKAGIIDIQFNKGPLIRIDKEHISLVNDKAKGISLGTEKESAEPAVLGTKNADALSEISDDFFGLVQNFLTTYSADAATASSLGLTGYATMVTQLGQLVTKAAIMNQKIAATKSTKITLD